MFSGSSNKLHRAAIDICAARDFDTLTLRTRRAARELTAADGVTFVLLAGDQCYYADEDAIAPLWKGQRFPAEHCVSGWAMRHKQAACIPDIYADPRVPYEAYRPTFVKSMVMVPARKIDPIGAIGAYWQDAYAPTAQHVQILELLAEAVGAVLPHTQHWVRLRDAIAAGKEPLPRP